MCPAHGFRKVVLVKPSTACGRNSGMERYEASSIHAFNISSYHLQTLGWAGFVNVDGVSYSFLGAPDVPGADFTLATQQSFEV